MSNHPRASSTDKEMEEWVEGLATEILLAVEEEGMTIWVVEAVAHST
jgi:hypothetical protein